MENYYICTAIAYTNGKPHIGHALEFTQADCLARYQRLQGKEVHYQTGTDEFGSKMYNTAEEQGTDPQSLADKNSQYFRDLCENLQISHDYFIRTSAPEHRTGAQKIWQAMTEAEDIYKDTYEGLYCVGCEAYLNEKDLVDGLCPNHKKAPELLKEENYFFRLSKYNEQIKELISTDQLKVYPEARKNEMLSLLEQGLQDVSFSRPKSVLPWGVEVPNDSDHVMYVWCDALSNYITGLDYENNGELFQKFWPASMHVIGKDILRFHAGIWIGMLLSAGLEVPKGVAVHGFVTSEGHKMSKSLGNVVDPEEITQKYGADPVRYYLLREIPTTGDGDFSKQRFEEVYSSELANNLGNLVSRTSAMLGKYNDSKVTELKLSPETVTELETTWELYHQHFANYDFKKAVEAVVKLLNYANKFIEDQKPWQMAKEQPEAASSILTEVIEVIRQASLMLQPYIPTTTSKILQALPDQTASTFAEALSQKLPAGAELGKIEMLFPRLNECDCC